jgi:hypothetical protein
MKKIKDDFDAVAFQRKRRAEIGEILAGKTTDEIIHYLKQSSKKSTIQFGQFKKPLKEKS